MLNPSNQTNLGVPFAGSLPENQQFYQTMRVCDSLQAKTTDSGLTHNLSVPATRKRSRDSITNQLYAVPNFPAPEKHAGEDRFMPYQYEIDSLISQYTKKIRLELEERQKQQARLLISALSEGVMKKLKDKDEQIQRIVKLNLSLQERVRSIFLENQLWRDLAQSNEATVNSLRTNLEQVLMQEERLAGGAEEDAESCCASSDGKDVDGGDDDVCSRYGQMKCRMCGERQSCVLLLPCRHLCLCGVCGSGSRQLQACPVCDSSMNATLHVNLSC